MRGKIRLWLPLAISGLALFGATAAHAAKPAVQACVGQTISAIAHQTNSRFAATIALANGGLGEIIQAGQAGLIPDSEIPNTCND